MTDEEFNRWLADYSDSFPETAAWLNGQKEKRPRILAKWKMVFDESRCSIGDLLSATKAMILGQVDSVAAYDRETTAAKVTVVARDIRWDRKQVEPSQVDLELRTDNAGVPMNLGGLFRKLEILKKEGKSEDERLVWLNANFPDKSADRRDWYKCSACLDTGMIRVIGCAVGQSYNQALQKIVDGGPWKESVVACHCQQGKDRQSQKCKRPLPTFCPTKFVRCQDLTADKVRSAASQFLKQAAGGRRQTAFDAFNNQPQSF